MTEEEEDKKLLNQDEKYSELFSFRENPWYIKNGELRDYQIQGVNWMIQLQQNKISGILADEMGLGKTLQTIALLGYMKYYREIDGPFLIIVPKSTLQNWSNEFQKWCPSMKAVILIGSEEERQNIINEHIRTKDFDAIITSYEMVLKCGTMLKKTTWEYIIIDEAHRIKNENSKLSEMVRMLKSKNRLLLTGTPLQNNLHELWALLNFLLPDLFSSAEDFDSWFQDDSLLNNEDIVGRLHKVLQPFLLRRLKSDVEKSLLPKKEVNVYIGLSAMQREWYTKILMKDVDTVNSAGVVQKTRLMNVLMHLRKCCNHPYLFDGAEPTPFTTDKHLVDNCGKMILLDKLLVKLKEQGSRVLIFSQMTRMLDILEDYCFWRQHSYCRLDGDTAHELRQQQIDEYNSEGSTKFIFMLTTRAGGLGINLTSADVVILYDSDWNPQADLQAMDRAHRIGQKKQVRVFRFITEKTVEERIIEKAEMKLRLDSVVIQQGRLSEAQKSLGKDEMLSMIRHGAHEIIAGKDALITDEDIDTILAKAEARTDELNKKLDKVTESNLRSFAMDNTKSIYNFEGEDYRDKHVQFEPIIPPTTERSIRIRPKLAKDEPVKKPPPKLKQPQVYDFQFYPKRLHELLEKELYAFYKEEGYKFEQSENFDEKEARKEQRKVENTEPLTKEELDEREELLTQGFKSWNKRDFQQFTKAAEKHGREDFISIAKDIGTKTKQEVSEYSKVFWERCSEIADYNRIVSSIERGEKILARKGTAKESLARKFAKYASPYQEFQLDYAASKRKNYSEEEDRFMMCKLHELGFDTIDIYERIRRAFMVAPQFRFDWFIRSRTAQDLSKRCANLIQLIKKEYADEEEPEQPQSARKRTSTAIKTEVSAKKPKK